MSLPYRCLILDHDDTAVDSTAFIHYPSHVEAMRVLRPEAAVIDLDGWFLKNFEPGIMHYLQDELGLSEEELETEYRIWRQFNASRIPSFFPGFLETLRTFQVRGGLITVVSHSEEDIILNAYRNAEGGSVLPDLVFGWDYDETRRKPSPWPVERILEHFNLSPCQALIVDDLKPGHLMSRVTGVPIAAAGWGHRIPEIHAYMRENCDMYFSTVEQFGKFVLGDRPGDQRFPE
jgi:beta-phosphoglucomutase-like phosphatase (HAD superfamily)